MSRYVLTGNRDFDTVVKGIDELDVRASSDMVLRRAQISELAAVMFDAESDPDKSLIELAAFRQNCNDNDLYRVYGVAERVALCKEYTKRYSSRTVDVNTATRETVAILNNGYMQSAFEILCKSSLSLISSGPLLSSGLMQPCKT